MFWPTGFSVALALQLSDILLILFPMASGLSQVQILLHTENDRIFFIAYETTNVLSSVATYPIWKLVSALLPKYTWC